MSKVQEKLDKKTAELCSQLGVAYLHKKNADERVKKLESALEALNSLAPEMKQLEQELIKDKELESEQS